MANIIIHVDVNSAFLSWSAVKNLKENPKAQDLRDIPSIVCGDVESRHGIVTAASIPAKEYGIFTGEPVTKALEKYPKLELVKADFKTYKEYSRKFISILKEYSDKVEQLSIDEAFVDISEIVYGRALNGVDLNDSEKVEEILEDIGLIKQYAMQFAISLSNKIYDECKFTVNIGVSTNKLLAKMASDFEKPNKIHFLFEDDVESKMWPLDIEKLYGCGDTTTRKLHAYGLWTIGEVAGADEDLLTSILGDKLGEYIHLAANGIGDDIVNPEKEDAKSCSNELTTMFDITFDNYEKEMPKMLKSLSSSVASRLQKDGLFASNISVSIKTNDFKRKSKQTKILDSTNDERRINEVATRLMEELVFGDDGIFAKGLKIRLVGVGTSDFDKGEFRQMNIFELLGGENFANLSMGDDDMEYYSGDELAKIESLKADAKRALENRQLDKMLDEIEKKFGSGAVHKGSDN